MIRRLLRPLTRSFAAAASPKPTHDTHHHADTHAASHHQRGSGEHHDHDHEHHEHHDHDQVDPEAFAKLPYAEQVRIYNEALSKQIRFGHPIGQKRSWEAWELVSFPGIIVAALVLIIGLNMKKGESLEEWAREEIRLRRLERAAASTSDAGRSHSTDQSKSDANVSANAHDTHNSEAQAAAAGHNNASAETDRTDGNKVDHAATLAHSAGAPPVFIHTPPHSIVQHDAREDATSKDVLTTSASSDAQADKSAATPAAAGAATLAAAPAVAESADAVQSVHAADPSMHDDNSARANEAPISNATTNNETAKH